MCEVPTDLYETPGETDILPLKGQELALPQSGTGCTEECRIECRRNGLRMGQEEREFFAGQEVDRTAFADLRQKLARSQCWIGSDEVVLKRMTEEAA
jgi:hypothetical protein